MVYKGLFLNICIALLVIYIIKKELKSSFTNNLSGFSAFKKCSS